MIPYPSADGKGLATLPMRYPGGVGAIYRPRRRGHTIIMALLKIARMGHPILRRAAEAVADPTAAAVARLVADMIDTMADAGGVGLAAPQVHVALRVVVYHVPAQRDADGQGQPLTVLINPVLEPIGDGTEAAFEACLSLPGLAGVVPRHVRVGYRAVGLDGMPVEGEAAGFHARVLQHECDHLDGRLYPMRMADLTTFGFADEIRKPL